MRDGTGSFLPLTPLNISIAIALRLLRGTAEIAARTMNEGLTFCTSHGLTTIEVGAAILDLSERDLKARASDTAKDFAAIGAGNIAAAIDLRRRVRGAGIIDTDSLNSAEGHTIADLVNAVFFGFRNLFGYCVGIGFFCTAYIKLAD